MAKLSVKQENQSFAVSINDFKTVLAKLYPPEKDSNLYTSFVVDDSNRNLLNDLFMYVNDSGNLDYKKGIWLWGDIGTGKSSIMKILGEVLRLKNQGYKTVNCTTLSAGYSTHGIHALNESTYNETSLGCNPVNRCFDELGREPIPSSHFGTQLNVMQYVFQVRYELRNEVRTFVTTNMNPSGIRQLYGSYISDRADEMFNIVELKGVSRRK